MTSQKLAKKKLTKSKKKLQKIDSQNLPTSPLTFPSIRKLALCTRRVNPALDPGGSCKGLVETSAVTGRKRLITVRERPVTVRAKLATVRARLATLRARLATVRF